MKIGRLMVNGLDGNLEKTFLFLCQVVAAENFPREVSIGHILKPLEVVLFTRFPQAEKARVTEENNYV